MAKLSAKAFYSSQMEIVHQAGRQLQKWIMLIRLFPIYCSVMPTSQQPHCQTYWAGNPLCATRRLVKLLQYYRRFAYFLRFPLKRFAYFLRFPLKRFAYFLRFLAVPQIWVPVALRQEGYSTGRRLSSWL